MSGDSDNVRIFIVSAIRLYREGLSEILNARNGFEVVGSASDAVKGVSMAAATHRRRTCSSSTWLATGARATSPDSSKRPLSFPSSRSLSPNSRLTSSPWPKLARAASSRARASLDELADVLRVAARGEALCSPQMIAALLRRVATLARENTATSALTGRELEVMALIDEGLSNKQIARRLSIELPTVKNHVHHILEKLGVQGRYEAAARLRAGG